MKTLRTAVLLLCLTAAAAVAGDPATWFDLEGCGMCKHLLEDQDLFQHMTWKNHKIANGLIEVTTYPDGYAERFDALMKKMEATGAKMMAGEQMPMCNMCRSYGGLMMAGATMEQVPLDNGYIGVITATDPQTIAMIHEHVDTTIEAYDMMMASQGDGHGHDHHGHAH